MTYYLLKLEMTAYNYFGSQIIICFQSYNYNNIHLNKKNNINKTLHQICLIHLFFNVFALP